MGAPGPRWALLILLAPGVLGELGRRAGLLGSGGFRRAGKVSGCSACGTLVCPASSGDPRSLLVANVPTPSSGSWTPELEAKAQSSARAVAGVAWGALALPGSPPPGSAGAPRSARGCARRSRSCPAWAQAPQGAAAAHTRLYTLNSSAARRRQRALNPNKGGVCSPNVVLRFC